MAEWQPIETALRDDWPVLVWSPLGVAVAYWDDVEEPAVWTACAGEDTAYDARGRKLHVFPTHWMPRPPPPGNEGD